MSLKFAFGLSGKILFYSLYLFYGCPETRCLANQIIHKQYCMFNLMGDNTTAFQFAEKKQHNVKKITSDVSSKIWLSNQEGDTLEGIQSATKVS